jgi:hypothetical protein
VFKGAAPFRSGIIESSLWGMESPASSGDVEIEQEDEEE